MIQAVTFDLDGTVIDSTEAIVDTFLYTLDKMGEKALPRERIVGTIGHTLEDQFKLLCGRDPAECSAVYRAHYREICLDKTHLLPGAVESLERLRAAGLRLGFATSKRREYASLILEHLGALDYFSSRIGPEDVTHPKPHPEAIEVSLERLGARPGEMVFVGDMHFDVLAAQRAGVRCLCVTTGYADRAQLEDLGPEAVFDALPPLTDYLLQHLD